MKSFEGDKENFEFDALSDGEPGKFLEDVGDVFTRAGE